MDEKTPMETECAIPGDRDAALADRAWKTLKALIEGTDPVPARFGAVPETVAIPTPAFRLLKEILDQMAHGNGVALTPLHAELTTRQAAELLQVSRTHLVRLLDDGRIACRKVGAHRRVRAEDVLAYRRETAALERILRGCANTDMEAKMCRTRPASAGDTPRHAGGDDVLARYDDNRNGKITCKEARRHGIAPVPRSHPAYRYMRDGDGDGVVCE